MPTPSLTDFNLDPEQSAPMSGSCADGIDWHGLQYGLDCLRTKDSQLKAKGHIIRQKRLCS